MAETPETPTTTAPSAPMAPRCGRPRGPSARATQVAVATVFFLHGALFASWTAHVPEVKARLHLGDGSLGLALLGVPFGSVAAMLLTGALLSRVSSRTTVRVTTAGYCLTGAFVGLAGSPAQLFVALAVWGAFQGTLDVSMNAQGIAVERAAAKPIMPVLHGCWSVGTFLGAGAGAIGVATRTPLTTQLLIIGIPGMLAGMWMSSRFVNDPPRQPRRRGGTTVTGTLVILGVIAFAAMLGEGAAADWAAVYLRTELHVVPGLSGLGYAAFAAAMVAVRLSGIPLLRLAGPRRLISVLALVATLGMAAGLLLAQPVAAVIGFAALGLGLGSIVPTVFSAAGNQPGIAPGTGVAAVSVIGWVGWVCGPPLIGFIAENTSLPAALGLLPVLTLFIAAISWRVSAIERADPDETA